MEAFEPARFRRDAIAALLPRVFAQRGLVDQAGRCDADGRQQRDPHRDADYAHS